MKPKFFIAALTLLMLYSPLSTFAQSPYKLEKEKPKVTIKYQGDISLGYNFNNTVAEAWEDGNDEYIHGFKSNFSLPSFFTVHGIRITNKDRFASGFLGIGIGVQYAYGKINKTSSERWNTMLLPIFLNAKIYFPVKENFSPFITASAGGNLCLMNGLKNYGAKNKGGMFAELGIGFQWKQLGISVGFQEISMSIKNAQNLTGGLRNSFEYYVPSGFVKLTFTF